MFEKCGLRDIFVRIGKLKWLILVLVLVGAAVGGLMHVKDMNAYTASQEAENKYAHKMYTGYAFYYVTADVNGGDTSSRKLKTTASSFVKIFSLRSTSNSLYKTLLENHKKEEIGALLDAERYADEEVDGNKLYKKSYGIKPVSNNTLMQITVCAETKDMCKELLAACRQKLVSVAKKMPDVTVKLQGNYLRHQDVDSEFFDDKTTKQDGTQTETEIEIDDTDTEEESKSASAPGMGKMILWVVIGLLAGVIIAIGAAIFRPTINRGSDFEMYNTKSLGQIRKSGYPTASRIILKQAADKDARKIVLVSTLGKDKRINEFCKTMSDELNRNADAEKKVGIEVALQPDLNGSASDICEKADLVVAVERKAVTKHYRYDTMNHYLEVIGKEINGALLLS